MGKYNTYKKDSTVEKKVLQKYGIDILKLGGALKSGKGGQGGAQALQLIDQQGAGLIEAIDANTGQGASIEGSTASGALSGLASGAAFGPLGMGIGAVVGGATGFFKQRASDKAREKQEQAMLEAIAKDPRNSPIRQLQEQQQLNNNIPAQTFKTGGKLNKYQQGGLTEYNGLTHEQGGLPIGQDSEVEDGETRIKDFIFSDSINYDNKTTFADQSKKINKKFSYRPNDSYSIEARDRELESLANQQESIKGIESPTDSMKYGGRIKYYLGGGFDPSKSTSYDSKEELESRFGKNNVKYDVSQNIYYAERDGEIIGFTPSKSKKHGKFTNEQALKIMKQEYLKDPKSVRRGWNDTVHKMFDDWVKGKESGYYRPEVVDETEEELEFEDPEDLPLDNNSNTFKTPTVDPLKPDYLGIAASALPGLISGIGNFAVANKIDYNKISPDQIKLRYLDPTRSIQNQRTAAATARENLRQNTRASRFAANTLASQALEARGVADVLSNYDNRNVEIANRERVLNLGERSRAAYANADIARQEQQDRLGFQAAGISGLGSAVTGAIGYGLQDKRFRDYQKLLQPDVQLGRINGETMVVPTKWATNSAVQRANTSNTQDAIARESIIYDDPSSIFGEVPSTIPLTMSNNQLDTNLSNPPLNINVNRALGIDDKELGISGVSMSNFKLPKKFGGKIKNCRRRK